MPCSDNRNVHKLNTDQFVLDICNNHFKVPISLNERGRTHPIGKVQIIARVTTYRQRQVVNSSISYLKNNPPKNDIVTFKRNDTKGFCKIYFYAKTKTIVYYHLRQCLREARLSSTN